jgi:hypothetical protein
MGHFTVRAKTLDDVISKAEKTKQIVRVVGE